MVPFGSNRGDRASGAPANAFNTDVASEVTVSSQGAAHSDGRKHVAVDFARLDTINDPNDENHQFAAPDHAVANEYRHGRRPKEMTTPDPGSRFGSRFISDSEMATKYGDGLSFWFIILKWYGAFFGGLTLLFVYFFVSTSIANDENGTSTAELSTFARASLGAFLYQAHERSRGGTIGNDDKSEALALVSIDAVATLLVLAMTMYLYTKKERHKRENDAKTVDLTDYTSHVTGLPDDVTKDEVKNHFQRFGEVHAVVLARDVSVLIKLRQKELSTKPWEAQKRQALRDEMALVSPLTSPGEFEEREYVGEENGFSEETRNPSSGCRVVGAFVTFAEERGRFACDTAVTLSVAVEKETQKGLLERLPSLTREPSGAGLAVKDDIQNFASASGDTTFRLKITPATSPSDLIWANFGFDPKTGWVRSVVVNLVMLCFLLLQFTGVAYATRGVESSINPIPQCSELTELNLGSTFSCVSVWDFDGDPDKAMKDMRPFIKQSVSERQCSEFTAANGALKTDVMAPFLGFADDNCTAYPDGASATVFRDLIRAETTYSGGFLPNSIVDECAAHLCYACACDSSFDSTKQRGGDDRKFDGQGGGGDGHGGNDDGGRGDDGGGGDGGGDGGGGGGGRKLLSRVLLQGGGGGGGGGDSPSTPAPTPDSTPDSSPPPGGDADSDSADADSFCDEYDTNAALSSDYAIGMVIFTILMNVSLKGISKALSQLQAPHSFTALEKSITRKLTYSITINMVFLPIALTADVAKLSWMPLMFDGDLSDTDKNWYQGYCNKFSQVALTNAIVMPLTAGVPVLKWWIGKAIKGGLAKTQYALNKAYAPPQYEMSQRAAIFSATLIYSLLFSSAVPLVYPYLMAMCGGFLLMDRLVLAQFCATPPRYRGRICAFVIHSVPLGVLMHFALAVYTFGARDLPSYVFGSGETGEWQDYGTTLTKDSQADIGARVTRVNGLIPLLLFVMTGAGMILFYGGLYLKKIAKRENGVEVKPLEGAPPFAVALQDGLVQGLPSYELYDHPEYAELFPKGHAVCKGL